jgi:hypothetical protein
MVHGGDHGRDRREGDDAEQDRRAESVGQRRIRYADDTKPE